MAIAQGKRQRTAKLFCTIIMAICGLILLLPSGSVWAEDSYDLTKMADRLPYRAIPTIRGTVKPDQTFRLNFMLTDTDGDGRQELVCSNGKYLLGVDGEDFELKPSFQINQAPGWRYLNRIGTHLAVATDLDRDGVAELNVAVVSDDLGQWRFQTIDLASEATLLDVPLPIGEDRIADGTWDGHYLPIGLVSDADGRGNPAVVLLCSVAYDATGRGVLAVDPRDGRVVWQYECGPNPVRDTVVVEDLNGDGQEEIVFFGSSPDNLGGVRVNGFSDDRSCLIVLSSRGNLLWYQELGGKLQHGAVAVHDFDDDGVQEIVTTTVSGRVGETHKLIIWDFNRREPIVTKRQGSRFLGLAILPAGQSGNHWLFTGSNDGYVTRYHYGDRQIIQDRRILTGYTLNRVTGAVDILPDAGTEVIVDFGGHDYAVFDEGLGALAVGSTEHSFVKSFPVLWKLAARDAILVLGGSTGYMLLDFEPNPRSFATLIALFGGVLLVGLVVALAYRAGLKRGRGEQPDPATAGTDLGPDPEELYRVWRQLDDVKHERFLDVNRGLGRLAWLLEAYVADLGTSESLRERIGQLLEEFSESMQSRLLQILRRARNQDFEPELVESTARALASVVRSLSSLQTDTLSVEAVQSCSAEMHLAAQKVADGFTQLWKSLRRYFASDPVHMLQGMILVREAEFRRLGVTVRFEGAKNVDDPVCLVDSGSLHFVLDNLLSNALQAMKDAPQRELVAKVAREGREVALRITDTGVGIAPEDRERIFNGRTSDRRGGGTGLFRSSEMLRKWGGEIYLTSSTRGKGTTFVVKLRAARAGTGDRALQGKA